VHATVKTPDELPLVLTIPDLQRESWVSHASRHTSWLIVSTFQRYVSGGAFAFLTSPCSGG
jgi:cytochrome c biogenesis protein CcdA